MFWDRLDKKLFGHYIFTCLRSIEIWKTLKSMEKKGKNSNQFLPITLNDHWKFLNHYPYNLVKNHLLHCYIYSQYFIIHNMCSKFFVDNLQKYWRKLIAVKNDTLL